MRKLLLSVLLTLILLSACSPAKSELDRNRDKWTQANITHYRFHLIISCFCAFYEQMPLTIEVKDGQVVSVIAANGADISNFKEIYDQVSTFDKLFDKLESAQREADEVKVEYDASYGFPTSIMIDYIKEAMDDEMAYAVSDFEVLK